MADNTPWKPPMWLIALDLLGLATLALGLLKHYSRASAVAQAIPATLEWPLLIVGGLLLASGSMLAAVSVLVHRRRP